MTQEQYDQWYYRTGKMLLLSPRVVRHIRSFVKAKCEGLGFDETRHALLRFNEKKLKEIQACYRGVQIPLIQDLTANITGLKKSQVHAGRIRKHHTAAASMIDAMGYRASIITFVKRMKQEQLSIICADIPDITEEHVIQTTNH